MRIVTIKVIIITTITFRQAVDMGADARIMQRGFSDVKSIVQVPQRLGRSPDARRHYGLQQFSNPKWCEGSIPHLRVLERLSVLGLSLSIRCVEVTVNAAASLLV